MRKTTKKKMNSVSLLMPRIHEEELSDTIGDSLFLNGQNQDIL